MAVARQRIHLPPRGWRRAITNGFRDDREGPEAIRAFERSFADFIGVPEAVVVPSGRAGLRFIFDAIGLERGSEVICSAFAYPVVPHLAHSLGYSVRFADCELGTLGMDPADLSRAISADTKVIIATHLYGVPCRIREIREIADAHGAILIEDCAHCYGASIAGRPAGSIGGFGYFSFETSKPINTMGGGIVTVSDPELAARVREVAGAEDPKAAAWLGKRLLKTSFEAIVTNPLVFNLGVYPALRILQRRDDGDRFASGYQPDETTMQGRMGRYTSYQAALGLDQIKTVAPRLERRIANAERLISRLQSVMRFQTNDDPGVTSNYMLVTAVTPRMQELSRRLLEHGVDTKHHYMRDCTAIGDGAASGDGGGDFPLAARAEREVLHLPAYPELSDSRIDWIGDRIQRAVAELGIAIDSG